MRIGYELRNRAELAWLKAPLSDESDKVNTFTRLEGAFSRGSWTKDTRDELPFLAFTPKHLIRASDELSSKPDMYPVVHIAPVLERTHVDENGMEDLVRLWKFVRPALEHAFLANPFDCLECFSLRRLPLVFFGAG